MKNNTVSILSVLVDRITIEEVLEKIKRSLSGKPRILPIMSVNPEIVIVAHDNPALKEIINSAYLRLPDGIGIVLAVKVLGLPKLTRITGINLTKKLVEKARVWSIPIGLIGAGPKVAEKAGEYLSEAHVGLNWWAEEGPNIRIQNEKSKILNTRYQILTSGNTNQPYNFNDLIDKINQTHTQILFCAFGAPKQEYFIDHLKQYQSKLKRPLIAVAVGGTLDEIANMVSPAPAWVDAIGFKWLWRLIQEPWRWRRQLRLAHFMFAIIHTRLSMLFQPK